MAVPEDNSTASSQFNTVFPLIIDGRFNESQILSIQPRPPTIKTRRPEQFTSSRLGKTSDEVAEGESRAVKLFKLLCFSRHMFVSSQSGRGEALFQVPPVLNQGMITRLGYNNPRGQCFICYQPPPPVRTVPTWRP